MQHDTLANIIAHVNTGNTSGDTHKNCSNHNDIYRYISIISLVGRPITLLTSLCLSLPTYPLGFHFYSMHYTALIVAYRIRFGNLFVYISYCML